jgi:uncharacterized lipoprotein NlpE involved in copper resistance
MKKLFIVLAVASLGFVACNNEAKTDAAVDSAATKVEEVAGAAKDSITSIADSAATKIDSAAKATVDSLKK